MSFSYFSKIIAAQTIDIHSFHIYQVRKGDSKKMTRQGKGKKKHAIMEISLYPIFELIRKILNI